MFLVWGIKFKGNIIKFNVDYIKIFVVINNIIISNKFKNNNFFKIIKKNMIILGIIVS